MNRFIGLLLLLSINSFAQDNNQNELLQEYYQLLSSEKFNENRIEEIEEIAIANSAYFTLRHYIAETYMFNHKNRVPYSRKDIYKTFLKPNNSINDMSLAQSFFLVTFYEKDYFDDLVEQLKERNDLAAIINLTALYKNKLQYDKAIEVFEKNGEVQKELYPYYGWVLALGGREKEAFEIAKEFEIFYESRKELNNPYMMSKYLGSNNALMCLLILNPKNTDIEKRKDGIKYCESSIANFQKGLLVKNNFIDVDFGLQRNHPYYTHQYTTAISLLTQSYLKDFYSSSLGIEQEKANLKKVKNLLTLTPMYESDEEILFKAITEIFENEDLNNPNYDNLTSQSYNKLLQVGSRNLSHANYVARWHLIDIHQESDRYKDPLKSYKYAQLSYKFDKEYSGSWVPLIGIYYYGKGVEKDKSKAHELLKEYVSTIEQKYSLESYSSSERWAMSALARDFIQGKVTKKDTTKAFEIYKNIYGHSEDMDLFLYSEVIDGNQSVDKEFLNLIIDDVTIRNWTNENNFSSYVAYKAMTGMQPFVKQDMLTSCDFAKKDKFLETNNVSKYIYSYCVLTGELEEDGSYKSYIENLSASGSSEASWFLYHIKKEASDTPNYKELESYLNLSKQQLRKKTSQKLIKNIWWLEESKIFDVRRDFLDEDIQFVKAKIKEEYDFQLALEQTKNRQEQERLAEIRRENRQQALAQTGNFLVDLLEFTLEAALFIGVAAVAGEALEDSSPEVRQAFADSLSSSPSGYNNNYQSKANSFECRQAKAELSNLRKKLNIQSAYTSLGSSSLQCSNVGPSCMQPLPKMCYNRAASCRPGDYSCSSRANNAYFSCQNNARNEALNAKRQCEIRKQQQINQCNQKQRQRVSQNTNIEIRRVENRINQYCY